MENRLHNSWKVLLLNGILALVYAVLAIFASQTLILTIITYIGILALLASFAMIYGVYNNYKNGFGYGNDLLQALLMLILGILLTFFSQKSIMIFVIIIGSWALLLGISQLIYAFKLPSGLHSKNTLLINSVLTIALGIILVSNPFNVASFMVYLSGVLSLFIGVILIYLAVKVKSFEK